MFIVSLFFLWFILRDLFENKGYMRQINSPANTPNSQDAIFSKVTMISLFIGGIGQLIAILILLIVFGYAQSQIKGAKSYTITLPSYTNLWNFRICLIIITVLMGLVAFVQSFSNANPETQTYMRSAITAVCSAGILGLMGYELYLSVNVLSVKQKNLLLYNVAD
jgi:hypothetical protein